jgi:hypothetical protein
VRSVEVIKLLEQLVTQRINLMNIKITLTQIKQEAKDYKKENLNIKHTQSLNAIAQKYGFEKYEILKAQADKNNGYVDFNIPIMGGAGMSFANQKNYDMISHMQKQGAIVQ